MDLKLVGSFQWLIIGPAGFKTGRPALKRAGFTIHNVYQYVSLNYLYSNILLLSHTSYNV